MSEESRPKQTAFRLPQKTIDALDQIIEDGKARTRTDALIWAVDTAISTLGSEGKSIEEYIKKQEEVAADIRFLKEQFYKLQKKEENK